MNVNETAILKKLVNGEREPAAHTEHATEKIRSRTQMRDLAQKFRRVPLFLERITFVGATDNFDISRNELPFLSFALRRSSRGHRAEYEADGAPFGLRLSRARRRP